MPGTTDKATMDVQSFRLVFDLERRLHRIDRWHLPFPNGIPLVGIAHAAAALAVVIALRQLPGIGELIAALPAPLTYVLAPAAAAAALTRLHIDGRPAHQHLIAQALAPTTSRRKAANRPSPLTPSLILDTTLLTTSPRSGTYPACVVTGPATTRLNRPIRATPRRNTLHLTPLAGPPLARTKTLRIHAGQTMKVRAGR